MERNLTNLKIFVVLVLLTNLSLILTLNSDEIPRGTSKSSQNATICGLSSKPQNTLKDCTEPLKEGIPDHRGNWTNTKGTTQMIEQCGDRYNVWGQGSNGLYYIHDFLHSDGTFQNGVDDFNALKFPQCEIIKATGNFEGKCMNMKIGNFTAATRCLNSNGTLTFYNAQLGTQLLSKISEDNGSMLIKRISLILFILGLLF